MSTKNSTPGNGQITQLRQAMFDQIERLNDPKVDLDKELKRANAITSVGTVIVNSVKVEIDYIRVTKEPAKTKPKQLTNGSHSK